MTRLTRKLPRLALATTAVAGVCAASAAAFSPQAGHWIGKVTQGQAMSGKNGEPTFTVKGHTLKKFTIKGVGAYCFNGYSIVSVYVPSARIKGGHFSTTYHPIKDANVKLTGHFVSATKVKGTVTGSGYACDYTIGFVAHRG